MHIFIPMCVYRNICSNKHGAALGGSMNDEWNMKCTRGKIKRQQKQQQVSLSSLLSSSSSSPTPFAVNIQKRIRML